MGPSRSQKPPPGEPEMQRPSRAEGTNQIQRVVMALPLLKG
jgi:hypothetical protein